MPSSFNQHLGNQGVDRSRLHAGADTSTVSKHLSILKNAGIITDRKQGTTVYYSLEAPCLLRFISCVEQVIEQNIQKQLASLQVRQQASPPIANVAGWKSPFMRGGE